MEREAKHVLKPNLAKSLCSKHISHQQLTYSDIRPRSGSQTNPGMERKVKLKAQVVSCVL